MFKNMGLKNVNNFLEDWKQIGSSKHSIYSAVNCKVMHQITYCYE